MSPITIPAEGIKKTLDQKIPVTHAELEKLGGEKAVKAMVGGFRTDVTGLLGSLEEFKGNEKKWEEMNIRQILNIMKKIIEEGAEAGTTRYENLVSRLGLAAARAVDILLADSVSRKDLIEKYKENKGKKSWPLAGIAELAILRLGLQDLNDTDKKLFTARFRVKANSDHILEKIQKEEANDVRAVELFRRFDENREDTEAYVALLEFLATAMKNTTRGDENYRRQLIDINKGDQRAMRQNALEAFEKFHGKDMRIWPLIMEDDKLIKKLDEKIMETVSIIEKG